MKNLSWAYLHFARLLTMMVSILSLPFCPIYPVHAPPTKKSSKIIVKWWWILQQGMIRDVARPKKMVLKMWYDPKLGLICWYEVYEVDFLATYNSIQFKLGCSCFWIQIALWNCEETRILCEVPFKKVTGERRKGHTLTHQTSKYLVLQCNSPQGKHQSSVAHALHLDCSLSLGFVWKCGKYIWKVYKSVGSIFGWLHKQLPSLRLDLFLSCNRGEAHKLYNYTLDFEILK